MENESIEFNTQPQQAQQMASQPQMPVQDQGNGQVKYAGFWVRFVANFIDGIVLIIPQFMVGIIVNITTFGILKSIMSRIAGILVAWVYFIWMTKTYQATLGKKVFGIKVLSEKAEGLTLGQVILRETIGKFVSMATLFIGYIMAGFTRRKQALHDKIASTVVVYNDPNKKLSGWAIFAIILACFLPFLAIIGILASIVLVSLNNAKTKACDASIKAAISSEITRAIIYQGDQGTLSGFKPNFEIKYSGCSEEPIVNISKDGKEMAIFVKLLSKEEKYFCADSNSSFSEEMDKVYAKSGATVCKQPK